VFGEERIDHEKRIRALFTRIPFEVVAPSRFAADFWQSKTKLPRRSLHVQDHCVLKESDVAQTPRAGPVRVAFLGHPSPHKGWEAFLNLIRALKDDERYEFHHLGAGQRRDKRTTFTYASVVEGGPDAMAKALTAQHIEVAFLWSIWPETFSFVAHEAVSAGASIITCEESGNIARIVRERDCGAVMRSENELLEAFRGGAVYDMAHRKRTAQTPLYVAEFSAMTFSLLNEE
jgi:glycosyltransferase involved in cell wall biosynthesis